ncbi:MAG TPA: arginine N-succinyltransferase [Sphingobium sp.]|nr:arginine N-succinyltransferase [Sphingobium sp.]
MSFVLRAAHPGDLEAIYAMAKSTGGGFTNLPPDRPALKAKLERAIAAFTRQEELVADDLFLFVLEDVASGRLRGTCQIFSKVGSTWPFYSYRISALTQYSKALDRTVRAEMLTLSTDLDGASEVGGLYLYPQERSSGIGALLARSRYLFMKTHRPRFAGMTIAELRGCQDQAGHSPFWDGVAGRFFGMSFREADDFNAIHGNQFIADLMPKHPIYTALLPDSALAAMGVPHASGRAAMRMLEKEGFAFSHYIDIFDGGPTMTIATDQIATIQQARTDTLIAIGRPEQPKPSIVAAGQLADFRACYGDLAATAGGVMLDEVAAAQLGVSPGDAVSHVPR